MPGWPVTSTRSSWALHLGTTSMSGIRLSFSNRRTSWFWSKAVAEAACYVRRIRSVSKETALSEKTGDRKPRFSQRFVNLGSFSRSKTSPEKGIIGIGPRVSRGFVMSEASFLGKCKGPTPPVYYPSCDPSRRPESDLRPMVRCRAANGLKSIAGTGFLEAGS